jgi:hypothetical protein
VGSWETDEPAAGAAAFFAEAGAIDARNFAKIFLSISGCKRPLFRLFAPNATPDHPEPDLRVHLRFLDKRGRMPLVRWL